ncbi:hypothetical protein [uncultured Cohaesibacter sp.]|uniref:hypothetical protein n=1 Tax=uncultured Cohaesibacter sp. TaxID=1002546 RepID=UPI0029C7262A|nr:hypothetical protein [uncultured Cohaesibacter sp.]
MKENTGILRKERFLFPAVPAGGENVACLFIPHKSPLFFAQTVCFVATFISRFLPQFFAIVQWLDLNPFPIPKSNCVCRLERSAPSSNSHNAELRDILCSAEILSPQNVCLAIWAESRLAVALRGSCNIKSRAVIQHAAEMSPSDSCR